MEVVWSGLCILHLLHYRVHMWSFSDGWGGPVEGRGQFLLRRTLNWGEGCCLWGENPKIMSRDGFKEGGLNVCSSVVLQGCQGLVVVWLLLLHALGVHSLFLHADDVWDAQPQERQPSDRPQRAPQTGQVAASRRWCSSFVNMWWDFWVVNLLHHLNSNWHFLSPEEGGGQGRLLSGPDLCAVLVPAAPQQDSKEDGLHPERCGALWAAQVSDRNRTSKTSELRLSTAPAFSINKTVLCLQFPAGPGLSQHQPRNHQLLHKPNHPLLRQQEV